MQNFYYRYLADGSKISVSDSAGNGFLYLGAARFEYDADGTSFESLPFSSGRIVSSSNGYEPQYHFTDHLGSTRVVATYDNEWTDIQRKNYSPFGKEWETPFFPESGNDLTFSGKEKQTIGDMGFLDFGARFYDSEGGIFLQQDPLAEKYYHIGQYNYCAGNPIKFVDPDGNIWVDANGNQMWNNGKWTQYATKDAMRVGTAMQATETGLAVFNYIASNPTEVKLKISNDIKINENTNSLVRGEFIPDNGNIIIVDGKPYAQSGVITIYEGSINEEINGAIHTSDKTSTLIKSLPTDVAVDGAIGSVGVHEGIHLTPKNITQQYENRKAKDAGIPMPHNIETDPIKVQNQYLEEYNRKFNYNEN